MKVETDGAEWGIDGNRDGALNIRVPLNMVGAFHYIHLSSIDAEKIARALLAEIKIARSMVLQRERDERPRRVQRMGR